MSEKMSGITLKTVKGISDVKVKDTLMADLSAPVYACPHADRCNAQAGGEDSNTVV